MTKNEYLSIAPGFLYLDSESSRLALNGNEFHCGESLLVLYHGRWNWITLEYDKEWYAFLDRKIFHQKDLIGLPARYFR